MLISELVYCLTITENMYKVLLEIENSSAEIIWIIKMTYRMILEWEKPTEGLSTMTPNLDYFQ